MENLLDAATFKTETRLQWDRSATGWNDHAAMIHEWLENATEAMLNLANVGTGSHVLDVAAGAGDQTLDIARRIGLTGKVLATDISPVILELAAKNLVQAGYSNFATKVADAERLDVRKQSFDAAVSRLGLMFCPEPLEALSGIHKALKPGGRACTLVFSTPQANPCIAMLMSVALKHAGLPMSDPFQPGSLFSLGKPGLIDDLFSQAGFTDVATTTISAPFILGSAAEYINFVRASASPVLQILGRLNEDQQNQAWAEIEEALGRFNQLAGWSGPNELLLTCGTRN